MDIKFSEKLLKNEQKFLKNKNLNFRQLKKTGLQNILIDVELIFNKNEDFDDNDGMKGLDIFYDIIDKSPVPEKLKYSYPSSWNKYIPCYQISKYIKNKKSYSKNKLKIFLATYCLDNFLFEINNFSYNQKDKEEIIKYIQDFFAQYLNNQKLSINIQFKTMNDD